MTDSIGHEDPIRLSIVVAARAVEGAAQVCVDALAPQVDGTVEVIVADDGGGTGRWVPPAWVRNVSVPGALVPELWAAGLRDARGDLIGLLAGTVVPDVNWVPLTLALHTSQIAALGGPILPGANMGPIDWALYFCRYASYELPLPPSDRLEVPGDNASYRADVLARYESLYVDGFWEPFVHHALRADGHTVTVRPERAVRQLPGARLSVFSGQRFAHGRRNGERRSVGLSRARVAMEAVGAPLVPALMALRTARVVFARRRHRLRFLTHSPLVVWFYAAWAAGELVGRISTLAPGARR